MVAVSPTVGIGECVTDLQLQVPFGNLILGQTLHPVHRLG